MHRLAFASLVLAATSFVTTAAQTGETTTVAATFQTGDLDGEVSSQAESLARKIAEHLSATKAIATSQEMLARGEPFTFDFEDGLQGWILDGSAQRVNTQVLGGEWAIFGDGLADGGASMSIELDLTKVASIDVDMFFLGNFADFVPPVLMMDLAGAGGLPERTRADPSANPTQLSFDLSDISGTHEIRLRWADSLACPATGPCFVPDDFLLALVDDVTLVPIPEPSTVLFFLFGGLGLVAWRWRYGRSSAIGVIMWLLVSLEAGAGETTGSFPCEGGSLAEKIVCQMGKATSQEMLANGQPFTFDFEDGLQGWTLEGSAQRVNTQVLGGEWAIFGDGLADGGASMSIELDVSEIESIVLDAFFPTGPDFPFPALVIFSGPNVAGQIVPAQPMSLNRNAQLVYDLSQEFTGTALLAFAWISGLAECVPGPCPPPESSSRLAFIDNVTLVPIPEPSTFLLVLGGFAAARGLRRESQEPARRR